MEIDNNVLAHLGGVHKIYGARSALAGVDLELRGGQVLALLGANGAGKTTAIGVLLGLVEADRGEAGLFGMAPRSLAARRRIGVMLQSAELPEAARVGELLELTRSYYPDPCPVEECVSLAGLDGLLQRPYGKLSGGQQRRVQFALALCGRPRVLFLDEPTTGLDIEARQGLWRAIRELVGRGCAVLLTTHYLEEAEALADRVCVLQDGLVVADGSMEAIRARVSRRRVRCVSALDPASVALWPHVLAASRDGSRLDITADVAEPVVRQLLDMDPDAGELEVSRAGLADAFIELTRESRGAGAARIDELPVRASATREAA